MAGIAPAGDEQVLANVLDQVRPCLNTGRKINVTNRWSGHVRPPELGGDVLCEAGFLVKSGDIYRVITTIEAAGHITSSELGPST